MKLKQNSKSMQTVLKDNYLGEIEDTLKKANKKKAEELTTEQLAELFKMLEKPENDAKKKRLEDVLIESENIDAIRAYAATLSPKDGERLYDIVTEIEVIKMGDAVEICELAMKWANHRKNYSLARLENAMIKTKKDDWMYWFAENVQGANVAKFKLAIERIAPQSRYLNKGAIGKVVLNTEMEFDGKNNLTK